VLDVLASEQAGFHVTIGHSDHPIPSRASSREVNVNRFCAFIVVSCQILVSAPARAVDPYAGGDPYWLLLHEPAVLEELNLIAAQRGKFQEMLDEVDLRYFPLRNKSSEEATKGFHALLDEVQTQLKTLLKPEQQLRLGEILLRQLGTKAALRDDVAKRLAFTERQREQIKQITDETQKAVAALEKDASNGKPREPLEKTFVELKTDEQTKVLEVLKPEQQSGWKQLLGKAFDLTKLGQPAFKAPELIDSKEWINAKSPLTLQRSQGKVVVVHFYASGCINCIHNYPSYREWSERFRDKDVVMIGIHTPETQAERDVAGVRRKAAAEKLTFPILIDGRSENWNAWGTSMWPSVYLIDKRGYLRNFWPGELKWQGSDGEKFMRERIEALLEE
jgi:thiol-disulfide isomerase/thioredoxin